MLKVNTFVRQASPKKTTIPSKGTSPLTNADQKSESPGARRRRRENQNQRIFTKVLKQNEFMLEQPGSPSKYQSEGGRVEKTKFIGVRPSTTAMRRVDRHYAPSGPLEDFLNKQRRAPPMSVTHHQKGIKYPSLWTEIAMRHTQKVKKYAQTRV